MKTDPAAHLLLGLARAGMELCWFAAWANFLTLGILESPYPWGNALSAFWGAALVGHIAHGRGRPIYLVLLMHCLGLAAALYYGLHAYFGGCTALWDPAWLGALWGRTESAGAWSELIFKAALSMWFWYGGLRWRLRPNDYQKTVHRFDLGLTAFLVLFLVKSLMRHRMETAFADPYAAPLLAAFLCFALLALALSRTANRAAAAGGTRGGVWQSATGLVLAAGFLAAGVAAFSLPYLTYAAEAGYRVLKAVAAPLAPVGLAVLRFLFAPRSQSGSPGGSGGGGGFDPGLVEAAEPNPWLELAGQVFMVVMALALLGVLVLLAVFALRRLWAWLRSRSGEAEKPPPLFADLRAYLAAVLGWIARRLLRIRPRRPGPVAAFHKLKAWGRRGGRPMNPGETPREYGQRLAQSFPGLAVQIGAVIQAHQSAVYAGAPWDKSGMAGLRKSLWRMASPLNWPLRLKYRLSFPQKP